jgi:hypothetical protein
MRFVGERINKLHALERHICRVLGLLIQRIKLVLGVLRKRRLQNNTHTLGRHTHSDVLVASCQLVLNAHGHKRIPVVLFE